VGQAKDGVVWGEVGFFRFERLFPGASEPEGKEKSPGGGKNFFKMHFFLSAWPRPGRERVFTSVGVGEWGRMSTELGGKEPPASPLARPGGKGKPKAGRREPKEAPKLYVHENLQRGKREGKTCGGKKKLCGAQV